MSKNTCEVCSKIFYSDGTTCNECATKMDGVERNKYDDIAPDITPSIASMSEVVAKYEGYEIDTDFFEDTVLINNGLGWYQTEYDTSWEAIHRVWEKVRGELPITNNKIGVAAGAILYGTPLEAFTALFNCIEFINKLKQEDNEK